MKHLNLLALVFLVLFSCTRKKPEIPGPEKIMDDFFVLYEQGGPREALKKLLPTNKYIQPVTIDSVSVQLERLTKGMGEFRGYEKVKESSYGTSISHLTYIVRYERQPLRLNFNFYKPGDTWIVQNFSYESDFLDELDETTHAKELNENR